MKCSRKFAALCAALLVATSLCAGPQRGAVAKNIDGYNPNYDSPPMMGDPDVPPGSKAMRVERGNCLWLLRQYELTVLGLPVGRAVRAPSPVTNAPRRSARDTANE